MYGTIIHLVNESSRLECELKPRGTAENIQSQQRKLSENVYSCPAVDFSSEQLHINGRQRLKRMYVTSLSIQKHI